MGVVIQAIRDSARGESCTLLTEDCNQDPATTVFCHGPRMTGMAGTGQKVDDWWGAYGCSSCHRIMDERLLPSSERRLLWLRAISKTQRRLYELGIMQFPERPAPPRVVSKTVKHPGVIR